MIANMVRIIFLMQREYQWLIAFNTMKGIVRWSWWGCFGRWVRVVLAWGVIFWLYILVGGEILQRKRARDTRERER